MKGFDRPNITDNNFTANMYLDTELNVQNVVNWTIRNKF